MAYVNVAEWKPDQVTDWLKGLDSSISPYIQCFLNNHVSGQQLLNLGPDDLDHLGIIKIGLQEIILEGVEHLRNIHYELDRENLQLLSMRLSCLAHSLHNELYQSQCETTQRLSTQILSDIANIVSAVKPLISWLDRPGFCGESEYAGKRKDVLNVALRMATCGQRDRFAEAPAALMREASAQLADIADSIVREIQDPLILQPASLDLATIKKRSSDDLGFYVLPSSRKIHQISDLKLNSAAHQSGKIEPGDEIIQINYQTVVGWDVKHVMGLFVESPTEVLLTLKKRPRHTKVYGQIYVKPYRLPSKKRSPHPFTNRHHLLTDHLTSLRINLKTIPLNKLVESKKIEEEKTESRLSSSSDEEVTVQHNLVVPTNPVHRRATITGASPLSKRPPLDIHELWHDLKLEKESSSKKSTTSVVDFEDRLNSSSFVKEEPLEMETKEIPVGNRQQKSVTVVSVVQQQKEEEQQQSVVPVESLSIKQRIEMFSAKEEAKPKVPLRPVGFKPQIRINSNPVIEECPNLGEARNLVKSSSKSDLQAGESGRKSSLKSDFQAVDAGRELRKSSSKIDLQSVEAGRELRKSSSKSDLQSAEPGRESSKSKCSPPSEVNIKRSDVTLQEMQKSVTEVLREVQNSKPGAMATKENTFGQVLDVKHPIVSKVNPEANNVGSIKPEKEIFKEVKIKEVFLKNDLSGQNKNLATKKDYWTEQVMAKRSNVFANIKANNSCSVGQTNQEISRNVASSSRDGARDQSGSNKEEENALKNLSELCSGSKSEGGKAQRNDAPPIVPSRSVNTFRTCDKVSNEGVEDLANREVQYLKHKIDNVHSLKEELQSSLKEDLRSSLKEDLRSSLKEDPRSSIKEDPRSSLKEDLQYSLNEEQRSGPPKEVPRVVETSSFLKEGRAVNPPKGEQSRVAEVGKYPVEEHGRVVETINRHLLDRLSDESELCFSNELLSGSLPHHGRLRKGIALDEGQLTNSLPLFKRQQREFSSDLSRTISQVCGETGSVDYGFVPLWQCGEAASGESINSGKRKPKQDLNRSLTSLQDWVSPRDSETSSCKSGSSSSDLKQELVLPTSVAPPLPPPRPSLGKPPNACYRAIIAARSIGKASPKTQRKKNPILAKGRNIGVKELSNVETQGWLEQRCRKGSGKWNKRWSLIHANTLYTFKNKQSCKAEIMVCLPGFTVSPAEEVKSRPFAFKVYHDGTSFYFAADSYMDFSSWLDAITTATLALSSHSKEIAFSESEGEEEIAKQVAPTPAPRQQTQSTSSITSDLPKKFGSLKKLTCRSSSSSSEKEKSSSGSGSSLDRKCRRLLGAAPVPVPTPQYRSYRRVHNAAPPPPPPSEVCQQSVLPPDMGDYRLSTLHSRTTPPVPRRRFTGPPGITGDVTLRANVSGALSSNMDDRPSSTVHRSDLEVRHYPSSSSSLGQSGGPEYPPTFEPGTYTLQSHFKTHHRHPPNHRH